MGIFLFFFSTEGVHRAHPKEGGGESSVLSESDLLSGFAPSLRQPLSLLLKAWGGKRYSEVVKLNNQRIPSARELRPLSFSL